MTCEQQTRKGTMCGRAATWVSRTDPSKVVCGQHANSLSMHGEAFDPVPEQH